jgi:hypothetical protein
MNFLRLKVVFVFILSAVFASQASADQSREEAIFQFFKDRKVDFYNRSEVKNRKYMALEIDKIKLPKGLSATYSYNCVLNGKVRLRNSKNLTGPWKTTVDENFIGSTRAVHTPETAFVDLSIAEHEMELLIDKKDIRSSTMRVDEKKISFDDWMGEIPPAFSDIIKQLETAFNREEVRLGPTAEDVMQDMLSMMDPAAVTIAEFEVLGHELIEVLSNTVSIGQYGDDKLLAHQDLVNLAVRFDGADKQMLYAKFSDSVVHVLTGAQIHAVEVEYKIWFHDKGVGVIETSLEQDCDLEEPEVLPETISNQLKLG